MSEHSRDTHPARRARMRVTSVSALAAALALVVSACSGGASGGSGATEQRNAGVIVHAQNGEPATLDPARAEQGEKGEAFIDNVYERLVDVGPDGPDLIPSLATEVPTTENGLVSEDRLTYTFPSVRAWCSTTELTSPPKTSCTRGSGP